jgi:hypothetical protein
MRKKIAVLMLMFVLLPTVALAQPAPAPTPNPAPTQTEPVNPCSLKSVRGQQGGAATTLPKCVNQIYIWSLGLAVLLAMLMIVVGGYYLMTSGGNAEQATKGKEYITSALVGVVILFCAYLLLNEINPDLVNFDLSSLDKLNTNR